MDSVEKAQDELNVVAPAAPQQEPPKSLEEVISGLKGFGIEEFEEILTIKCKNRDLRLKIANIPTNGGKTSYYVPQVHQFFVIHPKTDVDIAGLLVYRVNRSQE